MAYMQNSVISHALLVFTGSNLNNNIPTLSTFIGQLHHRFCSTRNFRSSQRPYSRICDRLYDGEIDSAREASFLHLSYHTRRIAEPENAVYNASGDEELRIRQRGSGVEGRATFSIQFPSFVSIPCSQNQRLLKHESPKRRKSQRCVY